MSIYEKKIAESTLAPLAGGPGSGFRCEFLFGGVAQAGSGHKTGTHAHPCWQLEICTLGRVAVLAGTVSVVYGVGESVLLPPRTVHVIGFDATPTVTLSLKFGFRGFRGERLLADSAPVHRIGSFGAAGVLSRAIGEVLSGGAEPSRARGVLLGDLISAFLHQAAEVPAGADPARPSDLAARIRQRVAACGGGPLKVRDLARELGLTVGYVSAAFKRTAGCGLKEYMDKERAACAGRLLTYSELTIGQAADRLGFPDPYTFSRFFKRTTGRSPREYRRAAQSL